MFSIDLIKEKMSLIQKINEKFKANKNKQNEKYYLINKKYTNEINEIFKINEINQIFGRFKDKNDKEILNEIKSNLTNDQKIELNRLNKDNILEILKSKKFEEFHIDYAFNDDTKGLLYCKNCDIITKEIRKKLKEVDKDIKKYCGEINCIFDENKIIIKINEEIINIANYKDGIIVIKYIIKSKNTDTLYNMLYQYGYKYISNIIIIIYMRISM